jgi:hypothetical protein
MTQVKGTAVAPLPAFVEKRFGEQGLERLLDSVPEDTRKILVSPCHPGEWYPLVEAFVEPTRKVCELFYDGDLRGAWECGRFSADFSLGGVYGILMELGTINTLVDRAGNVISLYYSPSKLVVVRNTDRDAVLRLTRFPGVVDVVERRIGGWIERAMELSGCLGARVEITTSMAAGAEFTEYLMTWDGIERGTEPPPLFEE